VGRDHPRRLLTYVLDGKAPLPPSPPPSQPKPVDDPTFKVDADLALKGRSVYQQQCMICHGAATVAGGFAPDLRASQVPLSPEAFASVVHGSLQARGMPPFPELTEEQLSGLRHYIRQQARYHPSFSTQMAALWNYLVLMVKMKLMAWGWIKP
jgi:quinohemoprotein ethanol dehydrogenase